MKTVKIELIGGDSATLEAVNRLSTRYFNFKDDIGRPITLKNRLWDAFDHLIDKEGLPQEVIIESIYEHAREGSFACDQVHRREV